MIEDIPQQRSRYWDDYLSRQKNVYNIDLLKDADSLFEEFTKSIGAWEPKYQIWDSYDFYTITLDIKNYGIVNLELKIEDKRLIVVGHKEDLKFNIKWLLPPGIDDRNIIARETSDNKIEINIPILKNAILSIKDFFLF